MQNTMFEGGGMACGEEKKQRCRRKKRKMKGEMNEIAVRNGAKGLKISSFYVINYEILGGAFSHPCMPPPPPRGGGGGWLFFTSKFDVCNK